jgi:hypothetical protein
MRSPSSRLSLLPPAVLLLAAAAACSPDFPPASRVDGLRLLAVRAEPPELAAPGDPSAPSRAALDSLVAHPAFATDPARAAVVLHVACTPDPGAGAASPCVRFASLSDPTELLAGADPAAACTAPGVGKRGAITFSGLEACGVAGCGPVTVRRDPADPASLVTLPAPAYELPADFSFEPFPAGAPERVLGLEVVDLALAIDATPAELAPAAPAADACATVAAVVARLEALWPARTHVVSVKRIQVRGPAAPSPRNRNPGDPDPEQSGGAVEEPAPPLPSRPHFGISLGGKTLPPPGDAPAQVAAGAMEGLLPVLPGDYQALRQTYVRSDAEGLPIETRQEDWAFSWFATDGDVDRLHTKEPTDPDAYTAPGAGKVAVVWTVVRDLRGGIGWAAGRIQAR